MKFFFHDVDDILNGVGLEDDVFDLAEVYGNIFAVLGQSINRVADSNHHDVDFGMGKETEEVLCKDVGFLF